MLHVYILFVFFKQKTAYEMRISDWSSDVCSSDLITEGHGLSAACRIRCGAARCGASTVEDAGCRALRRSACCASGAADLIADTVRSVPHIIRADEVSRSAAAAGPGAPPLDGPPNGLPA